MNAWFRAIERATTEAEVVAQARDFCCLLHPRDLAALPEDVRRICIDVPGDIVRLRERLESCGSVARVRALDDERVGELLAYVSRANAKLVEFDATSQL